MIILISSNDNQFPVKMWCFGCLWLLFRNNSTVLVVGLLRVCSESFQYLAFLCRVSVIENCAVFCVDLNLC